MDVVSHALAGAASGAVFGHPIIGAIVAVLPNSVLGLQRRKAPPVAYRYSHSVLTALCVPAALALLPLQHTIPLAVALAWLSHIALDVPTHGELWAPRLMYPFSQFKLGNFIEWEFGSRTWYFGSFLTLVWIAICLATLPA